MDFNFDISIMPESDNTAAIKTLLQTLELDPEHWETRKQAAEILFDEEQYIEAADMLWSAPEIPATDTEVAFAIKIISRAKPNRAIRMIYEIVSRNSGKPGKNIAVANALNDLGMYMQAARFYGAAMAHDPSLFDLEFEHQTLWMDDSNKLLDEWQMSDLERKTPLAIPNHEILDEVVDPLDLPEGLAPPPYQSPITPPPRPAARAVEPMLQHRRTLTPAIMQPSLTEVEPMVNTETIRRRDPASVPVPAQAVPTQPLPAAPLKAILVSDLEKEPISLRAAVESTTGKLLTPAVSNKPPAKLK